MLKTVVDSDLRGERDTDCWNTPWRRAFSGGAEQARTLQLVRVLNARSAAGSWATVLCSEEKGAPIDALPVIVLLTTGLAEHLLCPLLG